MELSKEKLKEIIESHGKWLRDEEGGQRADLRDANLRDTNLQDTNLQGAKLQRADLRDVDLRDANLRDTNLQDTNLQGAKLQRADLRDVDLRGANLQGANLQGADLQGADLQGADLQGADLQGADLQGAKLQRADLRDVDLPNGIYQIIGCGSYNRCTTYDSINDRVICGCWDDGGGNHLESFKKRIEAVYGDEGKSPNTAYYVEYMAAIKFFKKIREVERSINIKE